MEQIAEESRSKSMLFLGGEVGGWEMPLSTGARFVVSKPILLDGPEIPFSDIFRSTDSAQRQQEYHDVVSRLSLCHPAGQKQGGPPPDSGRIDSRRDSSRVLCSVVPKQR